MDRGRGRAARRAPLTGRKSPSEHDGETRRIVLEGELIAYRLHRSRRRTIGMQIGLSGLTVRAPRWVTIRAVESALAERSKWIVRTLAEWHSRRREVLPRVWTTGATILYQGNELALAVFPSRTKTIHADLFHVTVRHPQPQHEPLLAGFVAHWLREETLRLVGPHVAEFAARLSRRIAAIKLTNARTEWGSCNHKGEIRLNCRLVHLPPTLARYVAAHEAAHLVELNHSPRFWAIVAGLFPEYREAQRSLGDWSALLDG